MMDMLSGRMTKIVIDVNTLPVSSDIIGDYFNEVTFQQRFQQWINDLWEAKNERMRKWMTNTHAD